VGSSRTVTAPDRAPITTRLPELANSLPRRSVGSHSKIRLAAYEQLSHPESEIVTLISQMLAMLAMPEDNSMGGIFAQAAMSLISVTITSENVFTY
jgi:hypothetical protein